jgi:hypothetical protein
LYDGLPNVAQDDFRWLIGPIVQSPLHCVHLGGGHPLDKITANQICLRDTIGKIRGCTALGEQIGGVNDDVWEVVDTTLYRGEVSQ